jgi:hypothetical protein
VALFTVPIVAGTACISNTKNAISYTIEQTATLAAIADGYERGYAQADSVMRRRLHLAEWLWTLQCVAKSSTLLQGGLNAEMRLRRDDGANVAVTLEMSLRALAQLRW